MFPEPNLISRMGNGSESVGSTKDIYARGGGMPLMWSSRKLQEGEIWIFGQEREWRQIYLCALRKVRVPCGKMGEDAERKHSITLMG